MWNLQELGLIPDEVDIKTIISVNARNDLREVKIHRHSRELPNIDSASSATDDETDAPPDS